MPQSPEFRYALSLHVAPRQRQQFGVPLGSKTLAHRLHVTAAGGLINEHMEQAAASLLVVSGMCVVAGAGFSGPVLIWRAVLSDVRGDTLSGVESGAVGML